MDVNQALKSELESIKGVLEHTNAEKTAIDQIAMNNLKDSVLCRTQIALMGNMLNKKDHELQELRKEIELKAKLIAELEKKLSDTDHTDSSEAA